ncbi:efflux RND transporter periplasmic adaptor subunit [Euzebyella marina]|nr:efflux RND transporter periplasmic adaptor subunit [Euzebyella marina]
MKNLYHILIVIILASCGDNTVNTYDNSQKDKSFSNDLIAVTKNQFEKGEMRLGSIENKAFLETIDTNGSIDVPPEKKAIVNATMGGYIMSTPLLVGDQVKKGQLLVTIENPEFITLQQEYLEAKEQLTYLKSEYERQILMKKENITSQKNFLRAESEYKTTHARYASLRKQLVMIHISPSEVEKGNISSVTSIFAPISGSITDIHVSKGSYVSPASSILEIIDNNHIHLELSVFEKDIMKIKKGQEIQFKIPEASDSIFYAQVYLIGTSINENRTIKVHAHLKNEAKHQFLTGMFVNAKIVVGTVEKKALPSPALVLFDTKEYALALEKKEEDIYYFKQIELKTGDVFDNFISLEEEQKIDTSSQYLISGAFNLIGE